ncbi:MAG: DUF1540 domain-containing protein [Clostridiaceae bacterium]|nr:DUF1540 domain-containing protein [Eubacteriales bacterium]
MSMSHAGCQTIGCRVASCKFHSDGHFCTLDRIEVEPMPNGSTGDPADESLCGSYETK